MQLVKTLTKCERPERDTYYMNIALVVATRSTCRKYKVGCVCVSADDNIISTGYNGSARQSEHCTDRWTGDEEGFSEDHRPYADMYEIHAEMNTMLRARESAERSTLYVLLAPCHNCAKMIVQAGVSRVVYLVEKYIESIEYMRENGIICDLLDNAGELVLLKACIGSENTTVDHPTQ